MNGYLMVLFTCTRRSSLGSNSVHILGILLVMCGDICSVLCTYNRISGRVQMSEHVPVAASQSSWEMPQKAR